MMPGPACCRGSRLAKYETKRRNMRTILTSVLIGGLLAGAVQCKAQNTVINLVQELRFKLTAYYQMSETENSTSFFRHAGKISITNKDIINLLERQVNIIFSPNAKLMLISSTPVDLTPKIVVRDKFEGERFDTDVTQYFSAEVLASMEETKINKNPLKANGSSYDVIVFDMNLSQVEFRLQGFGKTKIGTAKYEGDPAALVHSGTVETSGSGQYQVSVLGGVVPVALVGTVKITGSELKASVE
jgi:hypothetical protein